MRKDNLQDQAYKVIKERIIHGIYKPGSLLKEEELQTDLGISRTPIREAVIRLQNDGLVVIRPKKGILVTEITIDIINSVFEIRTLLETYAAREYGKYIGKDKLLEFLHYYEADDSSLDGNTPDEFFDYDNAFHLTLMSIVGNPYFLKAYDTIIDQNNRFRILSGLKVDRLVETKKEHLDIIKAGLENNWEKAAHYLEVHFRNSKTALFNCLFYNK